MCPAVCPGTSITLKLRPSNCTTSPSASGTKGAGIASLRPELAQSATLWVGGSLAARLKQLPKGVCRIQSLADVLPALEAWRAAGNRSVPG